MRASCCRVVGSFRRPGWGLLPRPGASRFPVVVAASRGMASKVCVVGAAGGIGQPLSLLCKVGPASRFISKLSLYDLAPVTPGVAMDLDHCCVGPSVTGHVGDNKELEAALAGSDVVVVPAGLPRKPGMTRDDLFNKNAEIVANIAKVCSRACPQASYLVISNPVNSMVPIFGEILKRMKTYNPQRLFGVTTLDVVRANTFLGQALAMPLREDAPDVPVIGGHAGATILPLFSKIDPSLYAKLTEAQIEKLTQRVMFGGEEVVNAKAGGGSATLSMAYAGVRFLSSLLSAKTGGVRPRQCAYVESNVLPFFASMLELNKDGFKVVDLGPLSKFEMGKYNAMLPELKDQIRKGVEFGQKFDLSK